MCAQISPDQGAGAKTMNSNDAGITRLSLDAIRDADIQIILKS
jgi:hypothetical protein